MDYFIADPHFNHTNILRLCNRPFATIQDMNAAIITNWNHIVSANDTVYLIGDFAFGAPEDALYILKNLNGRKVLIRGNHDFKCLSNFEFKRQFVSIQDILKIRTPSSMGEVTCILSHFPLAEWDGYYRGFYHIYGHIHNNMSGVYGNFLVNESKALNAGVDINYFTPVTFDMLLKNNMAFAHNCKLANTGRR